MSRGILYIVVAAVVSVVSAVTVAMALTDRIGPAIAGTAALAGAACLALLETRRNVRSTDKALLQLGRGVRTLQRRMHSLSEEALRHSEALGRVDDQVGRVVRRKDLKAAEQRLEETSSRNHDVASSFQQALSMDVKDVARILDERAETEATFQRDVRAGLRQSRPEAVVIQVEAQAQLHERFQPRAPLVAAGAWSLSPTVSLELVDTVATLRPEIVLECGSGLSTVWLAYALAEAGHGRLVALEHDEMYRAQTMRMLDRHGLLDVAEVRLAPLAPVGVGDHETPWYSASLDDLDEIGLLLVDGPPAATGRAARYPAVPLLRDRLASGAAIILDDVVRQDERDVVKRWLEEDDTLRLDYELPGGAVKLRKR